MTGKLIAVAILAAAGLGAAAGYLQQNPGSLSSFTALALRGTGAPEAAYVPGKYYRLCRNEYANHLKSLQQAERREACRCFDKAFQGWSPQLQDAAKLAMHSAIVINRMPDTVAMAERVRQQDRQKLSAHQRQVLESQMRDTYGSIRHSYDQGLNPTAIAKARANPIATTVATARLANLASRCGIVRAALRMPDPGMVYKSVGQRN